MGPPSDTALRQWIPEDLAIAWEPHGFRGVLRPYPTGSARIGRWVAAAAFATTTIAWIVGSGILVGIAMGMALVALRAWGRSASRHPFHLHGQTLEVEGLGTIPLSGAEVRMAGTTIWIGDQPIYVGGHPRTARRWLVDHLQDAAQAMPPETTAEQAARRAVHDLVGSAPNPR